MKTKQTQGQTPLSRIMWFIMAAAAVFGLLLGSNARAAGLLIADGGFGGVLEIQEHDVHVIINNGVAVTRIDQVFRNTENRQVEALSMAIPSLWCPIPTIMGRPVWRPSRAVRQRGQ